MEVGTHQAPLFQKVSARQPSGPWQLATDDHAAQDMRVCAAKEPVKDAHSGRVVVCTRGEPALKSQAEKTLSARIRFGSCCATPNPTRCSRSQVRYFVRGSTKVRVRQLAAGDTFGSRSIATVIGLSAILGSKEVGCKAHVEISQWHMKISRSVDGLIMASTSTTEQDGKPPYYDCLAYGYSSPQFDIDKSIAGLTMTCTTT